MMNLPEFIKQNRFKHIFLLILILLGISTITRLTLFVRSWDQIDWSVLNVLEIFGIGMLFDLANAFYFVIPLFVYIWVLPQRMYAWKWQHFILYVGYFLSSFLLILNAVSEWFFWDEFNSRYNFIAVDYLIYTNEVIENIKQSYPIAWILAAVAFCSLVLVYFVKRTIKDREIVALNFTKRTKWFLGFLGIIVLNYFFIDKKWHTMSGNEFNNELAGNGMYELFAAYRNNELDYEKFYKLIDNATAFTQLHELLTTSGTDFISNDLYSVERKITNSGQELKKNVVLISVESLSADFMNSFGNTKGITPFLDSLANESLFFTNLYATGTRTVRGLEALSLSVPPSPGQSIVRRPNNENLFSIGKIFSDKAYDCKYIYGGYSYFDNMNYYFSNNHYEVVDRMKLKDSEVDYENVWGVADENLFSLSLREIEKSVTNGKLFFTHIMTTSNHRPYTYPEGRIDIPSHTGRDGAVKYTDYSIAKFIREASRTNWFSNTLFIIVADHCASSAGKSELPIEKYHIPMLIYAPGFIAPRKVDRLMSQIDICPTVLGLLNLSYTSSFFGFDIFKMDSLHERAFISTYQKLGYLKNHKLVILSPKQKVETFIVTADHKQIKTADDKVLEQEAISWYQSSSLLFKTGKLKSR